MKHIPFLLLCLITYVILPAQPTTNSHILSLDRIYAGEFQQEFAGPTQWLNEGKQYTSLERDRTAGTTDLIAYDTQKGTKSLLVSGKKLIPSGKEKPLGVEAYSWSHDGKKLLLFTNSKRVWRANTKGDYWVFDMEKETLSQLGKSLPASSLMFTKFSPDDKQVAYVSGHNLYVENVKTGKTKQLTLDGTEDIINGTFDWAYEEELACRDGFRWSADSKFLAFWQIDATEIRDFLMINNTDSTYSRTIPVQYPKVGEPPSDAKVATVKVEDGTITWLEIPMSDEFPYLPRMQWIGNSNELLVQQLNRKQNTNRLWKVNGSTGKATHFYTEKDDAWVDITHPDMTLSWEMGDPTLLGNGKAFVWSSEKDGWRHAYKVSMDGKSESLITKGDYDLARIYQVDPDEKYLYFNASPSNPTQRYLYRTRIDGKGKAERLTPESYSGVNNYDISPDCKFAFHTHSNATTPRTVRLISLPDHKVIKTVVSNEKYKKQMKELALGAVEFFTVKTEDGVEMDGRMIKPPDFDPRKKYPVLFNVYGEPWGQTATDSWIQLWNHYMAQQGYIVMTMDNRGTPCLKGREWRKSIYRNIGKINARDQAMAAKEIKKWEYVDPDRMAVWGWSGGGSMTLNLMFQYPGVYGSGVSVAPVANQLFYDNIYQERYMGLPSENLEDFVQGSPVTHAKNLEGNLLLIHGTADDNVHYQNAETLINELILHNKIFQVMPYPNRSHGIYEGQNTRRHLYTLISHYIMTNTPPGGKMLDSSMD